jgi:hypothetical protein
MDNLLRLFYFFCNFFWELGLFDTWLRIDLVLLVTFLDFPTLVKREKRLVCSLDCSFYCDWSNFNDLSILYFLMVEGSLSDFYCWLLDCWV